METTAEEVDGGFVLKGAKTWISNAPVAYVVPQIYALFTLFLTCDEETCLSYGHAANGMTKYVAF